MGLRMTLLYCLLFFFVPKAGLVPMNAASQENLKSQSSGNLNAEKSVEEILFAGIELPQKSLTNQRFKQDTGLYINWLDTLSDEEKWQAYIFLSQTSSGKKLAKNAADKYKERIVVNQGLGKELADVKRKLEDFININNSEIVSAGKWLLSALSKKGENRKQNLLEKGLVHKDDYNGDVSELREIIKDLEVVIGEAKGISKDRIINLQKRLDFLRRILLTEQQNLEKLEKVIIDRHGNNEWNVIKTKVGIK
jgi:hypothetical protein